MIHSMIDTDIGNEEFMLLKDQNHFEEVWSIIKVNAIKYANGYLDGIARYGNKNSTQESYSAFITTMIKSNDNLHDKYVELFDMDLMDEYGEDVDGFKNSIVKKDCDVIRKTLSSKSEALNQWKSKFYSAKGQMVYDTFYNLMDFAQTYEDAMHETIMESIDNIDDNKLDEMGEDACFLNGVIGYGIVSNILNHMYPRVFTGNYKAGIYALHFLTGKEGQKGINMPSDTSEFCMIKDDIHSKTGTIETEHNYYFPYQTFSIYSLRIYRILSKIINERFKMEFPSDYRFLLTNDFYNYVTMIHKADIQTMTGNDDMLKFNPLW